MRWRTHRFLKIVYVLAGSGSFFLGDNRISFSGGDVIIVPAGIKNRIEDDPSAASSLYVSCIAKPVLSFDSAIVSRFSASSICGDQHFSNRIASTMRRMLFAQQQAANATSIQMVTGALQLVQMLIEHPGKKQQAKRSQPLGATISDRELVKRYVDELPKRFFEQTTIEDAAKGVGLPRRTFTALFAEVAGESWLSRVRGLAIGHAKILLAESSKPVVSIAFECGFNDLSTFYRQFKSHCSVSPAKFRTQHLA